MSVELHPEKIIDQIRSAPRLIFADDVEIVVQTSQIEKTQFVNGEAHRKTQDDGVWVSVRLLYQKRPGRLTWMASEHDVATEWVDRAFESAKQSNPDPWFRFPKWRSHVTPTEFLGRPREVEPVSHYEQLKWRPQRFIETWETSSVRSVIFRKTEKRNLDSTHHQEKFTVSAMEWLDDKPVDLTRARSAKGGLLRSESVVEDLAKGLFLRRNRLELRFDPDQAFIFSSHTMAEVLRFIGPWLCSDVIDRLQSPWSAQFEKLVASSLLSVADDPLHENSSSSSVCDLEGTPVGRTLLIDSGRWVGKLYDYYHATKENRLSTGNWRRSTLDRPPTIAPWHLWMQPGQSTTEDLLDELADGFFIDSVASISPSAAPGSCWIRGSGWQVVNKEVTDRFVDFSFEVTLVDLLQRMVAVGRHVTAFGDCSAAAALYRKQK